MNHTRLLVLCLSLTACGGSFWPWNNDDESIPYPLQECSLWHEYTFREGWGFGYPPSPDVCDRTPAMIERKAKVTVLTTGEEQGRRDLQWEEEGVTTDWAHLDTPEWFARQGVLQPGCRLSVSVSAQNANGETEHWVRNYFIAQEAEATGWFFLAASWTNERGGTEYSVTNGNGLKCKVSSDGSDYTSNSRPTTH
jgi:hypothetical protein